MAENGQSGFHVCVSWYGSSSHPTKELQRKLLKPKLSIYFIQLARWNNPALSGQDVGIKHLLYVIETNIKIALTVVNSVKQS